MCVVNINSVVASHTPVGILLQNVYYYYFANIKQKNMSPEHFKQRSIILNTSYLSHRSISYSIFYSNNRMAACTIPMISESVQWT